MIVREVTNLKFDLKGNIETLFNPMFGWSPVLKDDAIFDILSGYYKYVILLPQEIEIIVKYYEGDPYLSIGKESLQKEADIEINEIICFKLARTQKLCSSCGSLVLKEIMFCWKCRQKEFVFELKKIMKEIKRQKLC